MRRFRQACSKPARNSLPPSTWTEMKIVREVDPDGLGEAFGVFVGGTGVGPSDEVLADGGRRL